MYDDLIKRLRNRRICIQQSGSLEDFPLLKEAAEAIENLSKEAKDWYLAYMDLLPTRWISVEELLPETSRSVLVTLKSLCRPGAVYLNFAACENGTWYEDNGHEPFRIATDRVTHWMPLPPAPKEET